MANATSRASVDTSHPLEELLDATNWTTIKFQYTVPRKGVSFAELRRSGTTRFVVRIEQDQRALNRWELTGTSQIFCRSSDVYWYYLGERTSDILEAHLPADITVVTNSATRQNIQGAANTVTMWSQIAGRAGNLGLPWFDMETLQLEPSGSFTANGPFGWYTIRGQGRTSGGPHELAIDYEQHAANGRTQTYRSVVEFSSGAWRVPRHILLHTWIEGEQRQIADIRIREVRADRHPDRIFAAANYFFQGVANHILSSREGSRVTPLDPSRDRVVWLLGWPVRSSTLRIGVFAIVAGLALLSAWSFMGRGLTGRRASAEERM